MNPLEPPDTTHLKAARGWLDLGNRAEANEELEKIAPLNRVHPDVLELRWQIHAEAKNWDACIHVAAAILQLAPERVSGWLMKSIALHGLGRFQEAWDTLLPAAEKFPHVPAVVYDLACYACRLGRLEEARHWLARAFEGEDAQRWKLMALEDADLEPLWGSLGKECSCSKGDALNFLADGAALGEQRFRRRSP